MVYEMSDTMKRALCDAKVDSQFARAMRYVENVDARAVVPSAGPPCFLDDDLFGLNMIDGDEMSIFPDQRSFLRRLAAAGRKGILNIPGTTIEVSPTVDRASRIRWRTTTSRRSSPTSGRISRGTSPTGDRGWTN